MEDEMILKQPSDRRLAGDTNDLPPGPPGAENDDEYNDTKKEEKTITKDTSKSRRRSPSGSPPPSKRKSPSRGPRSPRGRRTPSPRRRYGRNRDYSPDRRRFNDRGRMRRSPIRNRSRDRMDHRRNGRDRFRGRRDSRSRSRTNSPPSRRRWSPKKKPSSPPHPPGAQYGVPTPGMYPDAYAAYTQYGPPQQAYVPGEFVGAPPPAAFGAAYPPPPAWVGVTPDGYAQPNWVPQPESIPAPVMQPQPGVVAPQTVTAVQPPGTQPPPPTIGAEKKPDAVPTHDAVAQEAENQRDELKKQRTNYLKKTAALKKELKVLKDQRKDLIGGDGSHSPTTKGFLDENERLQSQIQKKLSTIENVIDMLTGIIGAENLGNDDAVESPRKHAKKKRGTSSSSSSDDSSSSSSSSSTSSSSSSDSEDNSSPERLKTKAIESMKHKRDVQAKGVLKEKKLKDEVKKIEEKKIKYVFYDPEMHWCKTCDAFPKTAKDYLTHLHSKEHSDHVETMETPWHSAMVSDEYPSFEGAPIKRTPIRGLTFFVPATAWYCKLCSIWMGDLHCASMHLKSKTHSNKYNAFLEKNPHFEVDWLADRQRVLNEKKSVPPPPQITSVSTTDGTDHKESKTKSKNDDKEKTSKKRKKKNSEKKDKKKKKRAKKRKKAAAVSPSSSSNQDSSSETEAKTAKKKLIEAIAVTAGVTGPPPPSIRVQMRNLKKGKELDMEMPGPAPPPPPKISEQPTPLVNESSPNENNKRDDLISQWNIVQPVISDSEKKLLEQLKGRLKNKAPPKEEEEQKKEEKLVTIPPVVTYMKTNDKKNSTDSRDRARSPPKRDDDRGDKDNDRGSSINRRRSRSRPARRSKSRSPSRGRRGRRSRSRGGVRRSRSRGRRSPSRGRYSPRGYGRRRRSRSPRRRSRSHGRSRRRMSSSRSRSRSRSGSHRIEKPIIRQPEFRPRVPEVNNAKKNKTKTNDEKEERKKSSSKSSSSNTAQSNKKLPFIGRMPVFKKQSQSSETPEKKDGEDGDPPTEMNAMVGQMPMVQDTYSHAGYEPSMMCEYDDLMPDPVQFVSLMGAPPPPPSQPPPQQYPDEDKDILPPGIDETESEFVPKPISDAPIPRKGPLPKDFEEALNIIFPGEKKPEDESTLAKSSGETQIITDEPVMQQSDLIKEGIHMMTVEETSLVGMDEASQMSMNEPLQFNKPSSSVATPSANNSGENSIDKSPPAVDPVEEAVAACVSAIPPPPPPPTAAEKEAEVIKTPIVEKVKEILAEISDKSPPKELEINDFDANLDIADHPSPTESEKNRRQEELDDLAMLGIDADDMAAQCI